MIGSGPGDSLCGSLEHMLSLRAGRASLGAQGILEGTNQAELKVREADDYLRIME